MGVCRIVEDQEKLSEPCKKVGCVNKVQNVIKNLIDTANAHKRYCAGLAANQIGYDVRVFVVKINGKFRHFINPRFVPMGGLVTQKERCLSFPGKITETKRYSIIVAYGASRGKKITLSGIEAIAFQHELDHLNGICV